MLVVDAFFLNSVHVGMLDLCVNLADYVRHPNSR